MPRRDSRSLGLSRHSWLPPILTLLAGLSGLSESRAGDPPAGGESPEVQALVRRLDEGRSAVDEHRYADGDRILADVARRASTLGRVEEEAGALGLRLTCLEQLRQMDEYVAVARKSIAAEEHRANPIGLARARGKLGAGLIQTGRSLEGLTWVRSALDVLSGAEGYEPDVANLEGTLAVGLAAVGNFAAALRSGERSAARWHSLGSRAEEGYALGVVASVLADTGAHERACELLAQALPLLPDSDSVDRADALANLGFALYRSEKFDEALKRLGQAEAVFRRLEMKDERAFALLHVSEAERLRGNLPAAVDANTTALAIAGITALTKAYGHAQAGDILLAKKPKDAGKAAAEYVAAAEAAKDLDDKHLEVDIHRGTAECRVELGDATGAVSEIRRALDLMDMAGAGLPDELQAFDREHRVEVYEVAVRAAVATKNPEWIADMLERSRAGALLDSLGGRTALREAGLTPELAKRERVEREKLVQAELDYQSTSQRTDEIKVLQAKRAARDKAQRAFQDATNAIQRDAKLAAGISRPFYATLKDMQAGLAPGDALVLYSLLVDPAGALVIRAKSATWVVLGPRARIEEAAAGLEIRKATEDDAWKQVRALADLVVAPLALGKDVDRLLVSPDGVLCFVPFPLLLRGADGSMPVESVAMVPSGTVEQLLAADRARKGNGILAVGDPVYEGKADGTIAPLLANGSPLPRLEATQDEVRAIVGTIDVPLLRDDATESRIRDEAAKRPRWSEAVFACHGLANTESPMLSWLAVTPGGGDDGFLSAHEVFRLRLSADLVVLSACDTARGKALRAEGLFGLPRAFMCAGSPRILASLWKVDSAATRALMTRYHEEWRKPRTTTAHALRVAQDFVRTSTDHPEWRHPQYWAAWVVWGLAD